MKNELIDRFFRYVKVDTRSKMDVEDRFPSTESQFDLANILKKELEDLGMEDIELDEHCYLMATLPSNFPGGEKIPVIGFLAHMDTSPDVSGKDVKPKLFTYQGGDIVLEGDPAQIITTTISPQLEQYIGKEIIVTDGTTLLGADDKAGAAEIMTALNYLMAHPEIKHGKIRVAFTPDEEVGNGTKFFNAEKFGADFAYTIDGGEMGQVENENFNASTAIITFKGRNVHPGYAKNKLHSSMKAAAYFMELLPDYALSPETTEQREGYLHPIGIEGAVEKTVIKMLIRDFELKGMEDLEEIVRDMVAKADAKYPGVDVELEIKESYKNMRLKIEERPEIMDFAVKAVEMAGVKPLVHIIRGGTDGARLSFMGLPTPNVFGGGHNFHSKLEWAAVPAMVKATETIINIIRLSAE